MLFKKLRWVCKLVLFLKVKLHLYEREIEKKNSHNKLLKKKINHSELNNIVPYQKYFDDFLFFKKNLIFTYYIVMK